MLISDVEKQTGLDRATIRFYEKEAIIVPERSENGYRTYSYDNVQVLLKVKLLRQLGVSLWKIKELQKGSTDFSLILSEQIEILENQIQENTTAILVCKQMQKDNVQYTDLDSLHYLDMFTAQALTVAQPFSERIDREVHPWRRYFARKLDYQLLTALLHLLLIVILRIRPITSTAIEVISYAACYLAVPILAIILHYFGTTPGKWAMGIRLESIHGGKLSGGEALYREGKIVWHGMGMFLPIVQLIFLYRSYVKEKEGIAQIWNEDTEIIYTEWNAKRKIAALALWVLAFSVSLYAGLDTIMPTYRGEGITIAQFSENHRDYEVQNQCRSEYVLGDDGKWQNPTPSDTLYFAVNSPNDAIRPEFRYEFNEFGEIRAVSYENSWENVDIQRVLPFYCEAAIYSMIGSRPGSNVLDYKETADYLESELYRKLSVQIGEGEGSFTVNDVVVSWYTQIKNCDFVDDGMMFAEDDAAISFTLKLDIRIQ